jgi:hypothetical protein
MHAGKSGELTPAATKGRRRLVHRLTLCVSRMNETSSRKENGAGGIGYVVLILPVRVRTCAENVGRTEERSTGSAGMQPVRTSNGRDGEASQRYFAGRRVGLRRVRASALWVKHAIEPPLDHPERAIRVCSSATWVRGAVMRGKRRVIQTG